MSLSPQNPLPVIDRWRKWFPAPRPRKPLTFTLKAQLERSLLHEDIKKSEVELEKMRIREIELRSAYLQRLTTLGFEIEMSKFKVHTRIWDLGSFDVAYDLAKEAEKALIDVIDDIHLAEIEIQDAQRTLDDVALWEVE